jgi:hypothetical protein
MGFFRVAVTLSVLLSHPAHAGPAPFRARPPDPADTAPLPRPPSDDRRPLELAGTARLLAPLCSGRGSRADCRSGDLLGGGSIGLLHRYSPYFAVGAEGFVFGGSGDEGVSRRALELSVVSRVHLLESGAVDPYLELLLGYGAERSQGGGDGESNRRGPSARIGGGLDVTLWDRARSGVSFAYREDAFGPGDRCARGRCERTSWVLTRGHFVLGLGLTVALGDPL